jgi:hypothetical protein
MKRSILLLALALAGGAVLAQAPATSRPPAEVNPNASGGKAQAKGEMNAESKGSKTGTTAAMPAPVTATMGNKAMDLNGDGFISRKEWDAYHGKMWGSMKPNSKGMVPWADVDAKLKGGPN